MSEQDNADRAAAELILNWSKDHLENNHDGNTGCAEKCLIDGIAAALRAREPSVPDAV